MWEPFDLPTEKTAPCPHCGYLAPGGHTYCNMCGWPLRESYPLTSEAFGRRFAHAIVDDGALRITFMEAIEKEKKNHPVNKVKPEKTRIPGTFTFP